MDNTEKEKEKEIDEQLKKLALSNWEEFKKITGLDSTQFIVCSKRKRGLSVRQISTSVNIKKSKVAEICKICP